MKRITAFLIFICIVTAAQGTLAYNIIERQQILISIINGKKVGGDWNQYEEEVYANAKQIKLSNSCREVYTAFDKSDTLTGSFTIECDVTPMNDSAGVSVTFETFDAITTANSGRDLGPDAICFDTDGRLIVDLYGQDQEDGTTVGYYVAGSVYQFQFALDFQKHTYKVYMTGAVKAEKDSEEQNYQEQYLGEFSLDPKAIGIGYLGFLLSSKAATDGSVVYVDNFVLTAGNIEYGLEGDNDFISAGQTRLPIFINQMVELSSLSKLKIIKNESELTLEDYSIQYESVAAMTSVYDISIILKEPTKVGDVYHIDLSGLTDRYETNLSTAQFDVVCVDEEEAAEFLEAVNGLTSQIAQDNGNLDFNQVTENILLPSEGPNGVIFSWISSSNENVLSTDGTVTRPKYNKDKDTSEIVTLSVVASKGSLSKRIELVFRVCMEEASEDYFALEAAYEILLETLPSDGALLYQKQSFPSEIMVGEKTVQIDYTIAGSDEQIDDVFVIEDGIGTPYGKQIESFDMDPSQLDTALTVYAVLSLGEEFPLELQRQYTIAHRHLLTDAGADAASNALLDADKNTAWEPEGNQAETIINLKESFIIGDMRVADGNYDSITFFTSVSGSDFEKIEAFPVEADKIKILVSKEDGNIRIANLEATLNDEQLMEFDVRSIEIQNSLVNITESYITLPAKTRHGFAIVWSSSDSSVIDQYGTVHRGNAEKTVVLTAKVKNEDGTINDKYWKDFSASVKAKESTSGGGAGGGGKTDKTTTNINVGIPVFTEENEDEVVHTQTSQEDSLSFRDITDHWAKGQIEYLAGRKIVSGKENGMFQPDALVTREEFVKMCVLAFGLTDGDQNVKDFTDIGEYDWCKEYIDIAQSCGVISGQGDVFGIGEAISREDMAIILSRILEYKGIQPDTVNENVYFTDEDQISDYALEATRQMGAYGYLEGFPDGSVRPKENATRAQAAALLFKMLEG